MVRLGDYYETLGLPYGAGDEDVQAAYERLIGECSPEAGDLERRTSIEKAYSTLTDHKRKNLQVLTDVLKDGLRT